MIVTVAGYKGGVGKTTTAIHIAACLQQFGKTLLIDGDPNRSVTGWAKRGDLAFDVIDVHQTTKEQIKKYEHVVIDTKARPEREDLEVLINGCNLVVLPTTPDVLALNALNQTISALKEIGTSKYKVLLAVVPPKPSKDGDEAKAALAEANVPVFQRPIRRYAAYQKAALKGVPVYRVNDSNARIAWSDYEAIAKELMS